MNTPIILALDASSTTIGWCVLDGAVREHGEVRLTGRDIAERCRQAHAALQLILANHPAIDCIAIESPVNRYAKSLIPQARVSGALMAVAALKGLHVVEVAPSAAKRALAGSGTAPKLTMRQQAALAGVLGEHAADALGVALAVATWNNEKAQGTALGTLLTAYEAYTTEMRAVAQQTAQAHAGLAQIEQAENAQCSIPR